MPVWNVCDGCATVTPRGPGRRRGQRAIGRRPAGAARAAGRWHPDARGVPPVAIARRPRSSYAATSCVTTVSGVAIATEP